ncbi:MAG: hypothetical protein QOE90_2501 [Thermoplasmata archaeon]|jgi:hypothetical protein|nr:hypothetical protein [Thermoplasmata archaeon]
MKEALKTRRGVGRRMDCGRCGSPLVAGAAFCARCGARAEAAGPVQTISLSAVSEPSGATRAWLPMPMGARVALGVAAAPVAMVGAFLLILAGSSLSTFSDGALLVPDASLGILVATGAAAGAIAAHVGASRRVETQGPTWAAWGVGAGAGALVASVLIGETQRMATSPVLAISADAFGGAAFLLAFAAAGALIAGAAVGGRHAGAPYLALVGTLAAFVAASLLYDGWVLLHASQLQAEARARDHRVPFSWLVPLGALLVGALLVRRRR